MSSYCEPPDPPSPPDRDDGPDPSDEAEREYEQFLVWRREIGEEQFWLMCTDGLPTDDSFGVTEYEYEEYIP